jgi:hypothetical protein
MVISVFVEPSSQRVPILIILRRARNGPHRQRLAYVHARDRLVFTPTPDDEIAVE